MIHELHELREKMLPIEWKTPNMGIAYFTVPTADWGGSWQSDDTLIFTTQENKEGIKSQLTRRWGDGREK